VASAAASDRRFRPGLVAAVGSEPDRTFLPAQPEYRDMSIRLYALDGCPWCETVHDALVDADIEYETTFVDPLHSDRNEVKRVSGQRAVPVLVDEERGVTMAESANIVEYVDRTLA
jgi:glutaredoxin